MYSVGKVFLIGAALIMLVAAGALAQAPSTLMYQGKLTDANLDPITTERNVIFTIFDEAEAGIALWTEMSAITPNELGIFTVELGATEVFPSGLFDGSVRFLEIQIEGDDPMTPRQPITSVPYSMQANVPGFANVYVNSASVPTTIGLVAPLEMEIPGPGWVVLDATGFFFQGKAASTLSYLYVFIDTLAAVSDYMAWTYHYLNSAYTAGNYYDSFALTRVIQADTAGTYTFYLNSYRSLFSTGGSLYGVNFKGVYYPSHLGTVTPIPPAAVMSSPDPQATPGVLVTQNEGY